MMSSDGSEDEKYDPLINLSFYIEKFRENLKIVLEGKEELKWESEQNSDSESDEAERR